MAYTWDDLPASGTDQFNMVVRAALNQWKDNFEASALDFAQSAHTHAGGDPIAISICDDETELGSGATDGELKICADTYGNSYTWDNDNSKWRVRDGNKYATGSLPTTSYTIPTGTRVFDVTVGGWKRWNGSAWVTDVVVHAQIAKTSSIALTATEVAGGYTITNDGAVAEVNLTWPTLAAGQKAAFLVVDAQYLKITAPTSKKIRYRSTEGAATGYSRSNVVGNSIVIETTADNLVITEIVGLWKLDE